MDTKLYHKSLKWENVKDIKVGDIVYSYPREAKDDPHRPGTLGSFSEYILDLNCELNRSVYKLKEGISIREACLIYSFTIGTRVARRILPAKNEKAIETAGNSQNTFDVIIKY